MPIDAPWTPHMIRLARRAEASVWLASFSLVSGSLLRRLPPSLPRLRALFLAREAGTVILVTLARLWLGKRREAARFLSGPW